MKRYAITAIAAVCTLTAVANDPYTAALQQINNNCPELHLYQREHEATVAENATGLTPSDPEVEFGYLWGNRLTGSRKDVSLTQSFDFPSVYRQRRRMAHELNASAELRYKSQRHDIMLNAKEQLINVIYCNAALNICREQARYARQVFDAYQRLYDAGEATQIDYNKAAMSYADAESELQRFELERTAAIDVLTKLNGGVPLSFDVDSFPRTRLPRDFDAWFVDAEQNSPVLRYLKSVVNVCQQNVRVVKSENMPQWSVGYMGEFVHESNFQGITLGFSIPLWQNRKKVNLAKSQTLVADAALVDARQDYYAQLQTLFKQADTYDHIILRYQLSLVLDDNTALLYKALTLGQMTLLDYVTETQYFYNMKLKLLQAQRDRELALAKLYSYKL